MPTGPSVRTGVRPRPSDPDVRASPVRSCECPAAAPRWFATGMAEHRASGSLAQRCETAAAATACAGTRGWFRCHRSRCRQAPHPAAVSPPRACRHARSAWPASDRNALRPQCRFQSSCRPAACGEAAHPRAGRSRDESCARGPRHTGAPLLPRRVVRADKPAAAASRLQPGAASIPPDRCP